MASSPFDLAILQGGAKSAINRRGKSKESRRTGAGGGHEDEDDGGSSACVFVSCCKYFHPDPKLSLTQL